MSVQNKIIMFTNKKEMTKENETSGAVNIIGVGTIITGDIQSKGDIRIDEVGETEHQEIDADTQGRGAVEYFDAGRGHYRGNKIKVVVQGVDAIDEERQQQAPPHHGIAENGLEDLFFTVGPVLDQRQRYLG